VAVLTSTSATNFSGNPAAADSNLELLTVESALQLKEIASLLGGHIEDSAGDVWIRGVASIADAGPEHVTFLGNPKYLPSLRASRAGAVLVAQDFSESVSPQLVRVENPSLAFAKLVERFAPKPVPVTPGIHPTAVVGPGVELEEGVCVQAHVVIEAGARIGARTVVGAFGFVGASARIGEDCRIHPRVTVAERCVIGNRVILHPGVVIGSDGFGFELSGGRHVKIPQVGIVQIDDDVEIGANTTVDRARFGRTWIQEGTKIDNLVQIAHNVVIGRHCLIVAQVGISGSTRLGDYVTLAGQVGVVGHIEIGDQSVVGAQSGVSKSLPGREFYMGSPAVPAGEYREQVAFIRRLSRLNERVQALEKQLREGKSEGKV
jgi:UDP-3-O-[3-hydroxymyristoyl] glucosamine N-acyltransferase